MNGRDPGVAQERDGNRRVSIAHSRAANRSSERWMLAALLAVGAVACGRMVSDVAEPAPPTDAGTDSPGPRPDANSDVPEDASGILEGTDDATTAEAGAGPDATTSGAMDAGNSDSANPGDANNLGDTEAQGGDGGDGASTPISCSETTSCASPLSLGSRPGGEGTNSGNVGQSAANSGWYQLEITQPPAGLPSEYPVIVDVLFQYAAGTDFGLEVYLNTDGPPVTCSQPEVLLTGDAGADLATSFQFNPDLQPVRAWITVHVLAQPGSQCLTGAEWSFQIYID